MCSQAEVTIRLFSILEFKRNNHYQTSPTYSEWNIHYTVNSSSSISLIDHNVVEQSRIFFLPKSAINLRKEHSKIFKMDSLCYLEGYLMYMLFMCNIIWDKWCLFEVNCEFKAEQFFSSMKICSMSGKLFLMRRFTKNKNDAIVFSL